MLRIVTRGSLAATPWKNGGGVTRQIACFPPPGDLGNFEWRISTAEVSQDGPFSPFAGIDRRLYLLEGAGLMLRMGPEEEVRLLPGDHADFPGEAAVHGRLLGGPVTDLNIMVRRDRWRAHFTPARVSGTAVLDLPWDMAAVFVRRGAISVAGGTAGRFDTIMLDAGHPAAMSVEGEADLLLIGFEALA